MKVARLPSCSRSFTTASAALSTPAYQQADAAIREPSVRAPPLDPVASYCCTRLVKQAFGKNLRIVGGTWLYSASHTYSGTKTGYSNQNPDLINQRPGHSARPTRSGGAGNVVTKHPDLSRNQGLRSRNLQARQPAQ